MGVVLRILNLLEIEKKVTCLFYVFFMFLIFLKFHSVCPFFERQKKPTLNYQKSEFDINNQNQIDYKKV